MTRSRIRRAQENEGPQAVGHARGQAPIALDALRDGVQSAPFLQHQHGRDGCEALGPGEPWLGETEAGRTVALHRRRGQAKSHGLDGRDHDRHHHGSTHCGGRTKRVVQDLPEHEKISYSFSESHWCTESTCQELIQWLDAWVRKRGFLHCVLLWDCASIHRKASLLEWIRTAHPECHVLFIPGGYTAELQPADISIQQPFKRIIKEQAMHFFAESVCRDGAVLASAP